LVTGGAGLVAGCLVPAAPASVEVAVTQHRAPVTVAVRSRAAVHGIDLRDPAAVLDLLGAVGPDLVVHTAYSQSERAGTVDTAAAVAAACAAHGVAVIHLSSDVVFAGDRPPYAEDAPRDPISDYGRWKVAAEDVVLQAVPDACTTRTSLVVRLDPPDPGGAGLVAALDDGREVRLFRDEYRQPILAEDLVAELWALAALDRSERSGVWHLPGAERLSRWEVGRRVARFLGRDPDRIRPASQADHPTPRPADPTMVGERRRALGHPPRPLPGDAGTAVGAEYGVADGQEAQG
jgi:dTDP-4-dehydrorhamnose reductase